MWRQEQLRKFRKDRKLLKAAMIYYRTRPNEFIEDWVDTFDPRNADKPGMLVRMPFVMFPRQRDLVRFVQSLLKAEENGLVEKTRDAGATWVYVAFSVWAFLFIPGIAIGWGSRKEEYVDKLGVMDSIFEKMRQVINGLPVEFLPVGFVAEKHMVFKRIMNPSNGATITGEAGDNIGRGGRTRVYFVDEAAHIERAELVEASLSANTRVRIDISSVNGTGNVFYRKRMAGQVWTGEAHPGVTNVFIYDWRDDPRKTQQWFDSEKARFTNEGLSHIFAQEYERDYASSVEGVIIKPEWIRASIDAHLTLDIEPTGRQVYALDVADGGKDKNALVGRKGILLNYCKAWTAPDVGETTRYALKQLPQNNNELIDLFYDCIGVGSGVKSEINRLKREKLLKTNLKVHKWDASAGVVDPDKNMIPGDKATPLNKDHYSGLKAQAWSCVAQRFFKTYQWVEKGIECDPDEIISIDSTMENREQLEIELSQATSSLSTSTMKVVVDKQPDGTSSPNCGDGAIMSLFPPKKIYTLDNVS